MNNVNVTGQRSPRWAFMQRMTIPCENGLTYLVRLRLVQTPWFAIYLHDLLEPDSDRDPHDHPWDFISIVLRGGYTERFYDAEGTVGYRGRYQSWKRWSAHRMRTRDAHMIVEVEPRTKTLILTGPRSRTWGFWTDGGFVPWMEYVE